MQHKVFTSLSVIIPAFNREKTIGYCLDSVLKQTIGPQEIIVVDDCSQDRTVEIIQDYMKHHQNIRLIRLDINAGAQVARNHGIRNATGDWIAFQDSDDAWLENKLENQMKALDAAQHQPYTVIHGDCYRYYPANGVKQIWSLPKTDGDHIYPELLMRPGPMFQSLLTSRQALEKIGLLDESVPSFQEWDTAIRLSKICRFIHIQEPLFIYYLHEGETISKNGQIDIAGYEYIINKFRDDILAHCGTQAWQSHLWFQLGRSIQFKLRDSADKYYSEILEINSL